MTVKYDKVAPALKRLLPDEHLDHLGRAVAFIRRLRALRASLFVWSVVMSRFGHGWPGFEQARQWYERLGGTSRWRRPFQVRFKAASAVRLFEAAFEAALRGFRAAQRPQIHHPLARLLPDIALIDSTTARVDDSLRPVFKGTGRHKVGGKGAALIKVLLTISAFGLNPLHAALHEGCRNDSKLFPPLEIFAKGTLLLFDRGFFAEARFQSIQEAGLHFLCPMKRYCTPTIVGIASAPQRVRNALHANPEGVPLRELLTRSGIVSSLWDLDIILGKNVRCRLVIAPGPDRVHRAYVTTLDRATWPARAISEIYRLRWQVELVFKELKQDLNLERIPTKDRHAAQVFVWASLLALAVSRTVTASLFPSTDRLGLAATARPRLTTRALRPLARLLGLALAKPTLAAALLRIVVHELRVEVGATAAGRRDSFSSIATLVPL